MSPPFHLAFPVTHIERTRWFYGEVLGCSEGRSADRWVDFDFFGHQISAHLVESIAQEPRNPVDGDQVPTRHFGAILPKENWQQVLERCQKHEVEFLIEPKVRFRGQPGEQSTFFVVDPSGNALEFKSLPPEQVFV